MNKKQVLNIFFYYKLLQKYYILILQIKYFLLSYGLRKKSENSQKNSDKTKHICSYNHGNRISRTYKLGTDDKGNIMVYGSSGSGIYEKNLSIEKSINGI